MEKLKFFLRCVLLLMPSACALEIPPDFSLANTSIETNAIKDNRDPINCECDLTFNACDLMCCCDSDCTNSYIETWRKTNSCFQRINTLDVPFPKCDAQSLLLGNSEKGEIRNQRPENYIMCLAYENVPYQGKFYNLLNASQSKISDTLLELKNTGLYIGSLYEETDFRLDYVSQYLPGDFVDVRYLFDASTNISLFQGRLAFPAVDIYGNCFQGNFIKYMRNIESFECIRNLPLDAVLRSNADYSINRFSDLLQISQDHQLSSFLKVQFGEITIIDIENDVISTANSTDNVQLNVSKKGDTCTLTNVLVSASFFISTFNNTISNVKLNAVLLKSLSGNCGSTYRLRQKFSVDFLTNTTGPVVQKSGNPGYLLGKPLIIGYLKTLNAGKAIQRPENGYLLKGFGPDGKCTKDPNFTVSGSIINFGENFEMSCLLELNFEGLRTTCSLSEINLFEIFHNFDSQSSYFGKYGNPNQHYINDWVGLTSYTNLVSTQYSLDTTNVVCMLPGIQVITVFYSQSGLPSNPQNYVLRVEQSYAKRNWTFLRDSFIEIMNFSLTLRVEFIKVDSPDILSSNVRSINSFDRWIASVLEPIMSHSRRFLNNYLYFICLYCLIVSLFL